MPNTSRQKNTPGPNIIRVPDGEICDYIDETLRKDTPEEYVRQTVEKRLVNEHLYKPENIKIEFTLKLGSRRHRADIVIFPENCPELTQDHVQTIIECKKEEIDPKNRKDGVEQLKSYMNVCPNCEWGMWTNGRYKEVLRKVKVRGAYEFRQYIDIPSADGSLEDVDRPKRDKLKRSYEDNLLMVFKTCHNHIYSTDGLQKQPAFFELLKLIFCKTLDEQNIEKPLEFYATSREISSADGQLTVQKRIEKIFSKVKKQFPMIFDPNEKIQLDKRSLAWIVAELQPYSLLETHVDVKGKAYEELVGANLRGDRGEFFTPRNIMRMAVKMINPKPDEKVCDTSCGTGGFLVVAMNHVISQLTIEAEKELGRSIDRWSDTQKEQFKNRIRQIVENNFYGFDISPELVKATKMNMVMNNDGSGNIYKNDSLNPPHEWSPELKKRLAEKFAIHEDDIKNADSIGFFDVIVTNPPFGSKIPIKDSRVLEQYEIGYVWRNEQYDTSDQTGWELSEDTRTAAPPEHLFIERCLQFLKPGGRLAIVLPDSILSNPGLEYIRHWLIRKARVVASIDLHKDTFQPRNGTETSVLIVQKKTEQELREEEAKRRIKPYNVFMATVERVGHDQRGNTIFKRDELGNEVWVPEEQNILETGRTAQSDITVKRYSRTRVIDDQSAEVPHIFEEWKNREGLSW